jgi:hypothetical protein
LLKGKIFINNNFKLLSYIKKKKRNNKCKKRNKNYNKKIKELENINKIIMKWANDNLITEYYKDKIYDIIDENMSYLYYNKETKGKNLEDIKNMYNIIYYQLNNSWEIDVTDPDDMDSKKDFSLICKQKWYKYSI